MNTFSITDLRHNTSAVLAAAQQFGYVSLVKNSQQNTYIVDAKYFQALLEAHEDYLDMLEFDAGEESLKQEKPIPFDQL